MREGPENTLGVDVGGTRIRAARIGRDGRILARVIEPVRTVQLLPTVITAALDPAGKVLGRPQFKIIQTKEGKITCTPSLGMQFDGEIISSNSGVFGARALPQCLDLIVDEFSPLGK